MSITSKAKKIATAPGELVPGQAGRAAAAKARADDRHEELVTVLRSAVDELRTGVMPSLNAIPVTAARPVTVTPGLSVQRIATSSCRLVGWSLLNNSANATYVRFRAGRDIAGDIVAVVVLAGFASVTMRVGSTSGVAVGADGLTMEVTTAGVLIEGSVYLGEVD